MEWEVALGHLDPATTVAGAQARLAALGLYQERAHGRTTERTRAALAAFQRGRSLPETGELDEATATRLREVRGH